MTRNKYVLIAVTLLVCLFLFEYYFLFPRSASMGESIRTSYYTLLKFKKVISESGNTEEEIQSAIGEIHNIEKKLIDAKNELFASASLQSEISGLAKKANMQIATIRPLSSISLNNYSAIPLYIEGDGDIKQIADFFKYLESSGFIIKLDKMHLNITNIQNPKILKFKIQVSALMKI